jgi:hypothetical protein
MASSVVVAWAAPEKKFRGCAVIHIPNPSEDQSLQIIPVGD